MTAAVQLAEAVVPVRVQVPVNVPVPLLENDTVPVGVVGVVDVSVTVAVQLVAWLIATLEGVHDTVVVVGCRALTASRNVPLLVAWVAVAGYVAVMSAWPVVVWL